MTRWAQRSTAEELMDDAAVTELTFAATLHEIAVINRWTRAYAPTLAALERFAARRDRTTPLHILDLGSGYGDMLRVIAAWAERTRVAVRLTGIDRHPAAARAAQAATPAHWPIAFETADVTTYVPAAPVDVVICSLFLHHFPDAAAAALLRRITALARLGWFVNDLHRHPIPYYAVRLAVRLVGSGPLVRTDAPLSIARAFTRRDLRQLVAQAGIDAARVAVRWHWPFRWGVTYEHHA